MLVQVLITAMYRELATKGNSHLLKEPDADRNLPLHICAANHNFTNDKHEHFNSVAYLVSEYPDVAAEKTTREDHFFTWLFTVAKHGIKG
jgi:hypothetical protein